MQLTFTEEELLNILEAYNLMSERYVDMSDWESIVNKVNNNLSLIKQENDTRRS